MFLIDFTPEAAEDLETFRKYDQQKLLAEIEAQLTHEPTVETHHRKRLRPNPLAAWELRVGVFRVFYDVASEEDQVVVRIVAVGVKEGNQLLIHGERFEV